MTRRGWKTSEAVSEAIRNLRASPARIALTTLVVALGTASIAGGELASAQRAIELEQQYAERGRYVVVAVDESGVEAAACSALESLDFVVAAGGVRDVGSVKVRSAPGVSFRLVEADIGALRVWLNPKDRPFLVDGEPGVYVGELAASELGAERGALLDLGEEGLVRVTAVARIGTRNPSAERALIALVAPFGSMEQCWVEFLPSADTVAASVTAAALGGATVSVHRLIEADEFGRDPARELTARANRLVWIPTVGAAVLLMWLTTWFRRGDIALYRAMGMSHSLVLVMGQVETALCVVIGGAVGYMVALDVYLALTSGSRLAVVTFSLRSTLSALVALLSLGPLPHALVGRRSIATLLKDR